MQYAPGCWSGFLTLNGRWFEGCMDVTDIYIYTHTRLYTCVSICTCVYVCVSVYICMYAYLHVYD